ncbi:MAG TPA: hypothetical protein VF177_24080 [Anaerolineae bacterium]
MSDQRSLANTTNENPFAGRHSPVAGRFSEQFNWQTEEDSNWLVLPAVPQTPLHRQPWFIRLLVLILLAGTLIAIWQQAGQRVDETTAAAQADVLAVHNLISQAAVQTDVELFRVLLAGQDPAWTAAQERLLAAGLLLDRAPYGLSLLPTLDAGDRVTVNVQMAPDLQSAEVVTAQPYVVEWEKSRVETVVLQQTALYRRYDDNWRLVPPEPAFWGEWVTRKSKLFTVIYPQRDQKVAARLATDLEATMAEICDDLVDIECPAELRLILRLETDPKALAATTVPARLAVFRNGLRRMTLPTPTLVGLPTDETSYQALYQGYAAQLTLAIDNHLAEWTCCVPFR